MKPRNPTETHRRRHRMVPARIPAKVQQEADFTAEGSPPPGKVGTERPALPDEAELPAPAVAGEHGKR